MSLSPIRSTVNAGIAVFKKILEVFDGGFSLTITGFNTSSDWASEITLDEGSLLLIDEEARTATPVKTALCGATGTATTVYVASGHHFQVGNYLGYGGTGARISTITASATLGLDVIVTSTGAFSISSAGDVFWNAAAIGATGTALITPNALSLYPVKIETGATVAAVRRGTAYKKRIQNHTTALVADLPATIQLSNSY